jgi:hypothetical protein
MRGSASVVKEDKIAVVFITYDRPEHFKKVLNSASEALGFNNITKIIIQQEEKPEINHFLKTLDFDYHLIKTRFGEDVSIRARINSNVHSGVTAAFENFGCETVIVIEDDIVVSKYFFTFIKLVIKHFSFDKRFRAVNGFSKILALQSNEDGAFGFVRLNYGVGWGWGIPKKTYLAVKDFWTGFEDDHWDALIEPFLRTGFVVNPVCSVIKNIGLEGSGVHSGFDQSLEFSIRESFNQGFELFPSGFEKILEMKNEFVWRDDSYSLSIMKRWQESALVIVWNSWWKLNTLRRTVKHLPFLGSVLDKAILKVLNWALRFVKSNLKWVFMNFTS